MLILLGGMARNLTENRTRNTLIVIVIFGLCSFFYILGAWQKSGSGGGDKTHKWVLEQIKCAQLPNLSFETHHSASNLPNDTGSSKIEPFKPCDEQYTDYTPCEEQKRAMTFPRDNMIYRERHCPPDKEKLYCLIPAPKGYVAPFRWPKSRDFVPYANVPHKSLTVEKAIQNWVHYEGDVFRFPGGGTQFPQGADKYIDQLASVIPIAEGKVRTALDTGCGVASLGAYLLKKNVLTMSFAPRDNHEAQVQFALERGVPAYIGVLGSIKLSFPSRVFDMAHCSRCLIPWSGNDGMYMMEVDRVLRPGGYWVLSGPPIGWKIHYKGWQRSKEDLRNEQRKIEQFAQLLCWNKISEKDGIAIWRKRLNDKSCTMKQDNPKGGKCDLTSDSDVWYKKMEVCIAPLPEVNSVSEVAGGQLEPFPKRLYAVPPRITLGSVPGFSVQSYEEDNNLWQKHVKAYKKTNNLLDTGRYRNIMDMNAGVGSFAAALESPKLWVMNVIPTIANTSTLGVIYERGLIGMYHDWCEGFSTYPRTYDLIHSNDVFSLYQNKCQFEDILLEMDRILRPEGAVIIRDKVDVLVKVEKIANAMRWKTRLADHEGGPHVPEKILFAVKQYWDIAKTSS
ncbi:probable methyltransferase PMT2 isoform X1 [Miscanthus floridulus]|uniref:probable methyltransferase PMT2 isoform X1 n=2 Tax=Miscanthus floridulus TaxID=154761 RepID=UPI003457FF34